MWPVRSHNCVYCNTLSTCKVTVWCCAIDSTCCAKNDDSLFSLSAMLDVPNNARGCGEGGKVLQTCKTMNTIGTDLECISLVKRHMQVVKLTAVC